MEFTVKPIAVDKPIFFIAFLKIFLSSAFSITFLEAPINSTPYFFKIFFFSSSIEIFKAVCPPIVDKRASGFSLFIMGSKCSIVSGSMYVESAISGSVIIVAGLEFTKITLKPSSFNALQA